MSLFCPGAPGKTSLGISGVRINPAWRTNPQLAVQTTESQKGWQNQALALQSNSTPKFLQGVAPDPAFLPKDNLKEFTVQPFIL